jgi:molybdopterin converting factor subunit 1
LKITTLYFGPLRERRGHTEETVQLDADCTAREAFEHLFCGTPEVGLPVAFAVNHTRVRGEHALRDGDTVAFLPPVGGG